MNQLDDISSNPIHILGWMRTLSTPQLIRAISLPNLSLKLVRATDSVIYLYVGLDNQLVFSFGDMKICEDVFRARFKMELRKRRVNNE